MTTDAAVDIARRTCTQQGAPERVADSAVIAKIAALLDQIPTKEACPSGQAA